MFRCSKSTALQNTLNVLPEFFGKYRKRDSFSKAHVWAGQKGHKRQTVKCDAMILWPF